MAHSRPRSGAPSKAPSRSRSATAASAGADALSSRRSAEGVRAFAIEAARLCGDRKCEDVVLLDVRERSQVCDYIVVASGTSERQMRTVAQEIAELGVEMDHRAWRSSVDEGGTWIVIDCVSVVVHLFEPEQRLFYDIEGLWTGAPRVTWRRPATAARSATPGAPTQRT